MKNTWKEKIKGLELKPKEFDCVIINIQDLSLNTFKAWIRRYKKVEEINIKYKVIHGGYIMVSTVRE